MPTKKPPLVGGGLLHFSRLGGLHQAFWCGVVVILDALFVASHLPIKLVNQIVDCGIQVFMGALRKHIVAFDMDIAFGALPALFFLLLFYCEQYFYVHDLIKVARDAFQFFGHVTAQGRRYFQMMAADCQIHK
jgi:hypothetical protein